MKFLTLTQPWASLIADGPKFIETRGYSTKYRGPLAIHAGKKPPEYGQKVGTWQVAGGPSTLADWCIHERHYDGIWHSFVVDRTHDLPLGAVVAVCDLVDVVPIVAAQNVPPGHAAGPNVGRVLSVEGDELWLDSATKESMDVTRQFPFGDFTPGRYGWLLENVRRIEPVPMKGALGIRDVPGDVLPQVLAQILP